MFCLDYDNFEYNISKAAELLYQRDYMGMRQIFVPEMFLTKNPMMISLQETLLDKKLMNPDLSSKELLDTS